MTNILFGSYELITFGDFLHGFVLFHDFYKKNVSITKNSA